MKKYIIAMVCAAFAAVMLCVGVGADTVASGECGADGDNLTWVLDDAGTLTISGEGEMEEWSLSSKVPWNSYRSEIKTAIIGNSITNISRSAFEDCSSLTHVIIGNSVTNIGRWAFDDCTSLTNVYITDLEVWCNIEYANSSSHPLNSNGGNLYVDGVLATDIVIPDSVVAIGEYAFYKCRRLSSVTISDGVMSIGAATFYECSGLISVIIPDSVTIIGDYAFYECSSLANVTIPDGVTSVGKFTFAGCSNMTSVTMPDGTTNIGEYAFANCRSLTSVNVPGSVTSIGSSAFFRCYKLSSITISRGIISIGDDSFSGCVSFKKAVVYSPTVVWGTDVFSTTHADFTIHGYVGSTAQTYAETNSHPFKALVEDSGIHGDATGDGKTNPLDLVYFQRYLSNWDGYDETKVCTAALDLNLDGRADAADATILARHIAKWIGYETLPYTPA